MSDFETQLRSRLSAIQLSFSVFDKSEILLCFADLGDFLGRQCSDSESNPGEYEQYKKILADYCWNDGLDFEKFIPFFDELSEFSDTHEDAPECISACLQGMKAFHKLLPDCLAARYDECSYKQLVANSGVSDDKLADIAQENAKRIKDLLVVLSLQQSLLRYSSDPVPMHREKLFEAVRLVFQLANKRAVAAQQQKHEKDSQHIMCVHGDEFYYALEEVLGEHKLSMDAEQLFNVSSLLDQLSLCRDVHFEEWSVLPCIFTQNVGDIPELVSAHQNINKAIAKVYLQANSLKARGYQAEAAKTRVLADSLQQETDAYFSKPVDARTLQVMQDYKSCCLRRIKYAQNILAEHRGTQKVLANVLYAVMGLGVGYGAAVTVRSLRARQLRFFNAPTQTRTKAALQKTQEVLCATVEASMQPAAIQLVA